MSAVPTNHDKDKPRFSVTNGPDSLEVSTIPETAEEVDALRERHSDDFWCPTKFGGCGAQMIPVAQRKHPDRRNYFRHTVSSDCPGADPVSVEHFLIQCELVDWLNAQGHQARIESTLASGGRADVHVQTTFGTQESIEVQLSPQSNDDFDSRTDRYHQDLKRVTWLHGDRLQSHAIEEAAERGISYMVNIEESGEVFLSVLEQDSHQPSPAVPLAKFRYCAYGVVGPHASTALRNRKLTERRLQQYRDRMLEGSRAWLRPAEQSKTSPAGKVTSEEALAIKSDSICGLAYRDTQTASLGSLIAEAPLTLTRQGWCPLTGKPLFQSDLAAATRRTPGAVAKHPTTVRLAATSTEDSLTMPAGCYPLAQGASWFGVPDDTGQYHEVLHLFDSHLPQRLDLPDISATRWSKFPAGSVLFLNPTFQYLGTTKKGDRERWRLVSGQIIHYPSWIPLAVYTDFHYVTLLLPKGVAPDDRGSSLYVLTSPISLAPTGDDVRARARRAAVFPSEEYPMGSDPCLSVDRWKVGPVPEGAKHGLVYGPRIVPWCVPHPWEMDGGDEAYALHKDELWPRVRESFGVPGDVLVEGSHGHMGSYRERAGNDWEWPL